MKLNKSKNKGKVHPSPSSSSSSSTTPPNDTVSTLNNLLPIAILTLISVLSLQDKEVLCYMITHSFACPTNGKKPCCKNTTNSNKDGKKVSIGHKIPSHDCGCFDCYTTYWYRWDSSPNRELIHQAIDAFEDHQQSSDHLKKTFRGKRNKKAVVNDGSTLPATASPPSPPPFVQPVAVVIEEVVGPTAEVHQEEMSEVLVSPSKQAQQSQQHKGLARKVLPDVIGLFHSRLWNIWGPNV